MSDILNKIKRLLALSESNNPHEAAVAAAEAQRLMLKHGIEMAELGQKQQVETTSIDTGQMNVWYRVLAKHVADATFCTIYGEASGQAGKSAGKVVVCGYKDDVAVAVVLLAWLAQEINRLCELGWTREKEHYSDGGLPSANAWKKSFRLGCVSTVGQRLQDDRKRQRQELATGLPDDPARPMALVRLDTYANDAALAVRKFLSAEGTRLSSSKAAGPRHGDAFAQGCEAGHRVGLTPPKRALTS